MVTPGGASSIKAGEAYVELGTEDAALRGGLMSAEARVKRFVTKVGALGRNMVKFGLAMSVPLALGVKNAASFQTQLAEVSTMLSPKDMGMLDTYREGLKKLAIEVGEGTDTLSKGLYDILSAGVPAAAAMDVLAVATKAAVAGMTDTGTAADALTTILNSYQMSADQAMSVSDLLFSVVKRGKTTFNQLAPVIGQVAAVASTSGLSLEEFGAALATMTRNGIPTDIAITALRATLTSFSKATKDAKIAAEKYGVVLSASTLKNEGLLSVLEKLQGIDPDVLSEISPNIRAKIGLAAMIQDVKGFSSDVQLMGKRAGKTEEAFKKMSDTATFEFKRLWQSIKMVSVEIGEVLLPDVRRAINRGIEFGKVVKQWVKNNKDAVIQFAKVAMALVSVGAALVAITATAKILAFIFSPLGAFAIVLVGLVAFAEAIGVLDTDFTAFVRSVRIGGASIGAWMEALGVGIEIAWEKAFLTLESGLRNLVDMFRIAGNAILAGWMTIAKEIASAFWSMAGAVAQAVVWAAKKSHGLWTAVARAPGERVRELKFLFATTEEERRAISQAKSAAKDKHKVEDKESEEFWKSESKRVKDNTDERKRITEDYYDDITNTAIKSIDDTMERIKKTTKDFDTEWEKLTREMDRRQQRAFLRDGKREKTKKEKEEALDRKWAAVHERIRLKDQEKERRKERKKEEARKRQAQFVPLPAEDEMLLAFIHLDLDRKDFEDKLTKVMATASIGTFSARHALNIVATSRIEKDQLEEQKKATGLLEKIAQNTGRDVKPFAQFG